MRLWAVYTYEEIENCIFEPPIVFPREAAMITLWLSKASIKRSAIKGDQKQKERYIEIKTPHPMEIVMRV